MTKRDARPKMNGRDVILDELQVTLSNGEANRLRVIVAKDKSDQPVKPNGGGALSGSGARSRSQRSRVETAHVDSVARLHVAATSRRDA